MLNLHCTDFAGLRLPVVRFVEVVVMFKQAMVLVMAALFALSAFPVSAEACGPHGCGGGSSFSFGFSFQSSAGFVGACGVRPCVPRFPVLRGIGVGLAATGRFVGRVAARTAVAAFRVATFPARALFGRPFHSGWGHRRRWGW